MSGGRCSMTLEHLGTLWNSRTLGAEFSPGTAYCSMFHRPEKDSVERTVRGVASTSAIPPRAWKIENCLEHLGTPRSRTALSSDRRAPPCLLHLPRGT